MTDVVQAQIVKDGDVPIILGKLRLQVAGHVKIDLQPMMLSKISSKEILVRYHLSVVGHVERGGAVLPPESIGEEADPGVVAKQVDFAAGLGPLLHEVVLGQFG